MDPKNTMSQIVDFSQFDRISIELVSVPGLFTNEPCVVSIPDAQDKWRNAIPLQHPELSCMFRPDGGFYVVRFQNFSMGGNNWESPIFDQIGKLFGEEYLTGGIVPRLFVDENDQVWVGTIPDGKRLPRVGYPEGMPLEVSRASITKDETIINGARKRGHSDQARQKDLTALGVIFVEEKSSDFDWKPIEALLDTRDMGGAAAMFVSADPHALRRYASKLWPRTRK